MNRSRQTFVWVIPIGLAVLARLIALLALRDNPFTAHLFSDSHHYWNWAEALREGNAPPHAFYQAPLYPYLLAVWRGVAGDSLPLLYAWQHLLGVLTTALVVFYGRRAGFGAGAAAAASLYAVHPYPIYFEQKVLSEAWAVPIALLAAGAVAGITADRARRVRALGAGLLTGVACVAKANLLLFGALSFLWLAFARRGARRERFGGAFAIPVLFTTGLVLVLAPIAARNLFVDGGLTIVAANGGEVFYHGNNANASGSMGLIPGLDADIESLGESSRLLASERAGRTLNAAEASRHWFGEGLRWIRENPAAWANLLAQKGRIAISGRFTPLSSFYDFEYERFGGWPRAFRFVHYPLFVLGVAAFFRRPARERFPVPFRLLALVPAVAMLLFFACTRYSLLLLPPLAIGAGATLQALFESGRGVRLRAASGLALVAVLFAVVDRPAGTSRAVPFVQLGSIHEQRGELEKARSLYREAAVKNPRDPRHRALIAKTYESEGNRERALEELDRALGEGVADRQTYAYRAFLLVESGDFARAEKALIEASARDPRNADLLRLLFRLYSGPLEDEAKARDVFERLVRLLQERGEPVITSPGPPSG
ncbi:MAG: tetratricopeptide repeat protein [Gemmatimonadetes bacterium]|nr:tetratricopeptide repeat protein [Gemmatimonadota bacterium]